MKFTFNPLAVSITSSTRTSPGNIKFNAGDLRKNVHGYRLAAHVEKRATLREVGEGQPFQRGVELRQCRIDRFPVLYVWLN